MATRRELVAFDKKRPADSMASPSTKAVGRCFGKYGFRKCRGGATGWAGWAFAHPVFQRSEAKNPSKLPDWCNLYVPTVDFVKI